MSYFFTSEAVSEGHPDKICDAISDAVVDLYLRQDPSARTAIETLATTNRVIISGETSSSAAISLEQIESTVRQTVRDIGYDQAGFSWRNLTLQNYLHHQSPDIALGVDRQGAGDQGLMFGYAKKEKSLDTDYMPLAFFISNLVLKKLSQARHAGEIPGILPDTKSQTTIEYDDSGHPLRVAKILVSTQHDAAMTQDDVRKIVSSYIRLSLPTGWDIKDCDILVNPTGRFVIGGPDGDTGLTGRKIVADTYGGYAPCGGGAFSGKDPTKVDRSSAYMLRYIAKNIVAAGLAQECLLQTSYAIGLKEPLSLYIDTKGTCLVDEKRLLKVIKEMFDLTPQGIIKQLGLQKPIYLPTSSYGHFGRKPDNFGHFSWELTNKIEELQNAF